MSKVNEAALRKRISTASLLKMKEKGEKFSSLTAYDASFAKLFDEQGVQVLLVGDSLGNVIQGKDDTLGVTIEELAYHTRCVRAASQSALLVTDMPFMSYATPQQACENAATLMRAGAQMVKLEGGEWLCDTIKTLVERSVPVCAHIGLMPQSVHLMGGYKVQGKTVEDAERILREAKALEAAGAQLLVIECVSQKVAKAVTQALRIPVIGIGAGPDTDGQVLVMHDLFGISAGHIPKFSKNFLIETGDMQSAVSRFVTDVAEGRFPAAEHSFD
ncbi:3-methyl-2-oxobutanoate hydroxymethyltransferase [Gallaecimonas kandeliae]|uniref:3-methyl-2-oxobutanoate hydroxymethyltransferase n=1 Tax=Gallaecimonas kandeliae TaxID=3029055 RepID=UPI00264A2A77|nr:3-methyl-2-oxobutanoate hydroxymethyltransferase [Gallaecimonas kandeliae]WKE66307.1 3-methyl-2-oxobutanoate hydroxymethyltransferase [Gallaecimonas kandeliae]